MKWKQKYWRSKCVIFFSKINICLRWLLLKWNTVRSSLINLNDKKTLYQSKNGLSNKLLYCFCSKFRLMLLVFFIFKILYFHNHTVDMLINEALWFLQSDQNRFVSCTNDPVLVICYNLSVFRLYYCFANILILFFISLYKWLVVKLRIWRVLSFFNYLSTDYKDIKYFMILMINLFNFIGSTYNKFQRLLRNRI